jgi:hypothetical protein
LIFGSWFGRLVVLNAVLEKPGAPRGKADFLFILLYCYRREGNCTALEWEYLL